MSGYPDVPNWLRVSEAPLPAGRCIRYGWTEADLRKLVTLRTCGLTWDEVGRQMHRGRDCVKRRYWRLVRLREAG